MPTYPNTTCFANKTLPMVIYANNSCNENYRFGTRLAQACQRFIFITALALLLPDVADATPLRYIRLALHGL